MSEGPAGQEPGQSASGRVGKGQLYRAAVTQFIYRKDT